MNTELFIARRLFTQKKGEKSISSQIVAIAVASITLGLAIMIIAVSILFGFKTEIREKAIGFDSHIQVVNFDSNNTFETHPITFTPLLTSQLQQIEGVTHIQTYATKPGIIKTDEGIHGIVLKGVDQQFDWSFFNKNLIAGTIPQFQDSTQRNNVLISEKVSKLLKINLGDPLYCYFYNEGENLYRNRKFNITGIYNTGFEEFDGLFALSYIKQVQQLNAWQADEISGYEIKIRDFSNLENILIEARNITLAQTTEESMLKVTSIVEKNSLLFDWLKVLDLNVWVLLALMLIVAGINMVSGLLVIILERTRMIGILKALGQPNVSIRKVFLYLAGLLAIKGMIWGNIIGIGLCLIQQFTGAMSLDPSSYYLDTVPILIRIGPILLLNIGTLVAILSMLMIPTFFIAKISPIEAIRFE